MFIETKFYDSGKAYAKLHKCEDEPQKETSEKYDVYIEKVDNLQEWAENELEIELVNVIVDFVADLENGDWVDITNYC